MKISKPYKNAKPSDVSQGFSYKHPAVDFASKYGTFLVAPENCIVDVIVSAKKIDESLAPLERGYGIRIKSIANPNTSHTYWHCLPVFPVKVGDTVLQGQPVAQMGNSGSVRTGSKWIPVEIRAKKPYLGTHLHWQYLLEGVPKDPLNYIDWDIPVKYNLLVVIRAIIQNILNLLIL